MNTGKTSSKTLANTSLSRKANETGLPVLQAQAPVTPRMRKFMILTAPLKWTSYKAIPQHVGNWTFFVMAIIQIQSITCITKVAINIFGILQRGR
jgi:predicted membrane-bound spermidine synthase